MLDVGSIILVRKLTFSDGEYDHAYYTGRFCLVIAKTYENLYFLTINSDNDIIRRKTNIPITFSKMSKKSVVNIGNIYKEEFVNYKQLDKVSDYQLRVVLLSLFKFYNDSDDINYRRIEHLLIDNYEFYKSSRLSKSHELLDYDVKSAYQKVLSFKKRKRFIRDRENLN